MKKLILIIGPNGVGKTTTATVLLQKLSKCAYVDASALKKRIKNPEEENEVEAK